MGSGKRFVVTPKKNSGDAHGEKTEKASSLVDIPQLYRSAE